MGIREETLKKLELQIATLERELKVDLPRQLAEAAAHGDLSENAEHEAAKDRKDTVTAMLMQLYRKRQAIAGINVGMVPRDAIGFGSRVELLDVDNDEKVIYVLVAADDSSPKEGRISTSSPIGQALTGKSDGDEIEVVTPRGKRRYEVLSFTTLHDDI